MSKEADIYAFAMVILQVRSSSGLPNGVLKPELGAGVEWFDAFPFPTGPEDRIHCNPR